MEQFEKDRIKFRQRAAQKAMGRFHKGNALSAASVVARRKGNLAEADTLQEQSSLCHAVNRAQQKVWGALSRGDQHEATTHRLALEALLVQIQPYPDVEGAHSDSSDEVNKQ